MSTRSTVLLGVALLSCAAPVAAAARPIVAVFPVELRAGVPGGARLIDALSAYLASRLGESGRFEVVPRARLRAALAAKRKDSYRGCYAQSCQIEIGQELAASVALATQVHRLGSSCVVMSNLYDLRKATSGTGATARGGCAEDALLRSLDTVVQKLTGNTAEPTAAPHRRSAGELLLLGSPDGARVVVAGKVRRECHIPCHLRPLAAGSYAVEVSTPGFLLERRTIAVAAGRVVAVSIDLRPGTDENAGDVTDQAGSSQAASMAAPPPHPLWADLRVVALTRQSREKFVVPPQVNFGVVVERVVRGSRPARHGVQVGDVILEVNGRRIETPPDLRRALADSSRAVRLLVHRAGRSFLLGL